MTSTSPELIRVRFSRFVQRALDGARARGMTDKDIEAATGVMSSTFHRWRRGEVRTMPGLDKVRAFCEGIGADMDDALAALGLTGERDNPEPEPILDPDLRLILRRLHDPNVPETEKIFIRESLRMLADRSRRRAPGTAQES
jgi:transcriptional regulator with XRE-family HTH domain